jgi:hypothetical protein
MITLEEFEIAAKDLAKAFKNIDDVTVCIDDDFVDEADHCRGIAEHAISIIKQYWIETASKKVVAQNGNIG